MKVTLRKAAAVLFILILTTGLLTEGHASAASSYYTSLTTQEQSGKGLYLNRLVGTEYYFQSSIAPNGQTKESVELYVPIGYSVGGSGAVTSLSASVEGSAVHYTASESGYYFLKIYSPYNKEGDRYYAYFSFQILGNASNTSSDFTLENRVVSHTNASYTTDIREGEVLNRAGVVYLSPGMEATVTFAGKTKAYTSGSELLTPGAYKMTFTSSNWKGNEEVSELNFTIGAIVTPEPEDYAYEPVTGADPNLYDYGKPLYGGDIVTTQATGETTEAAPTEAPTQAPTAMPTPTKAPTPTAAPTKAPTQAPEKEEPAVPQVVTAVILEIYHEEYELYEEAIQGVKFFYSSVKNGGITSDPVKLDFPSDLKVTAKKDGKAYSFTNKKAIKELGSYTFEIVVPANESLPVDYQVEYHAVFRFRSEKALPTPTPTPSPTPTPEIDWWNRYPTSQGTVPTEATGGDGGLFEDNTTEASGGETSGSAVSESTTDAENTTEGEGTTGGEDTTGETAADATTGEEGTTEPQYDDSGLVHAEEAADAESRTGLYESYDYIKEMFCEELRSGSRFYVNIPNGMVTNSNVIFEFPVEMTVTVTKDGEAWDYTPGDMITEEGAYRVTLEETKVDYVLNYVLPPEFQFRIIKNPTNNLEVLNLPIGFSFEEVTVDSEPAKLPEGYYLALTEEGTYSVEIRFDAYPELTYTTVIDKDITPPSFDLIGVVNGVAEGGAVQVEYYSDDIASYELYQNGDSVSFNGYTINSPGDYELVVTDEAGNTASMTFHVNYKLNMGAMITVVLVIAVAVAGFLFVRKTKKDMKVR